MAVITSTATGDWSAGGTWVGGVAPGTGDDAVIANTHTVTVDGATTTGSVTIQSGGTLLGNGQTLTIDDADGSTYGFNCQSGGTFTHGNCTIAFTYAGTQSWEHQGQDFYNVTVNKGGSNILQWVSNNLSITNDFTITSGQANGSSTTNRNITVTGDVSISGTLLGRAYANTFGSLTINSGGTFVATSGTTTITSETAGGYALNVLSGGTFTHNSGTLLFNLSASTNALFGGTVYNLTVTCGGYAIYPRDSALTVAGNLSITAGIFNTYYGDPDLTVTGTTTIGDGVGAASSAQLVCNSSTVDLNGNLTIDTDGALSLPDSSGSFNFSGASWVHKGVLTHNDGTFIWDGGANHTLSQGSTVTPVLYNFTIAPASGHIFYARYHLTVENILTITNGRFAPNGYDAARNYTIGTTTSAGSIVNNSGADGVSPINNATNAVTLKAASSDFPVVCTGDDWDFDGTTASGLVAIQDLDYRIAATTGGGGVTVTMTRCKFPLGMTISSGDTVKIAGNTCSGFKKVEGAGTLQIVRGGGVVTLSGIDGPVDLQNVPLPTALNPANICCNNIQGVSS